MRKEFAILLIYLVHKLEVAMVLISYIISHVIANFLPRHSATTDAAIYTHLKLNLVCISSCIFLSTMKI
jgi:hypothetical protein